MSLAKPPRVWRTEEDSGGDAAESGDVVGLDVAEAAGVSLPMVMAAAAVADEECDHYVSVGG